MESTKFYFYSSMPSHTDEHIPQLEKIPLMTAKEISNLILWYNDNYSHKYVRFTVLSTDETILEDIVWGNPKHYYPYPKFSLTMTQKTTDLFLENLI